MIVKKANLPGMVPVSGPGAIQTKRQQTSPAKGSGQGSDQGARGASQSGRPTEGEKQQVMLMQQLMSEFSAGIRKDPEGFSKRTGGKITPDQAINFAGVITDTGGRQTFDGKWGNKTIRALTEIAKLAKAIGSGAVISAGKDYKTVNPNSVIDLAKANVDSIATIMRKVGLGDRVPKNAGVRPERYDTIPGQISESNIRSQVSLEDGGEPVQPKDLDNIFRFYDLVNRMVFKDLSGLTAAHEEDSIKKLAKQIRDAAIVRMAAEPNQAAEQDASRANRREVEKPAEVEKQKPRGMTAQQFDSALTWFYDRASYMLGRAQDRLQYEDEDGNVIGSQEELNNAKAYRAAIAKLVAVWRVQYNDILDGRDSSEVVLNRSDLRQIKDPQKYMESHRVRNTGRSGKDGKGGKGGEEGLSRERSDSFQRDESGGQGVRLYTKAPNGPLSQTMNMSRMSSFVGSASTDTENLTAADRAWDWLNEYSNLRSINLKQLGSMSTSPGMIVREFRNPDSNYPAKRFAIQFAENLAIVLRSIYDNWAASANKFADYNSDDQDIVSRVDDTLAEQGRLLRAWLLVLERKKNMARNWHPQTYNTKGKYTGRS